MPLVPPSKNVSGYGAVPLESGELIDPAFVELSGFSPVGHGHAEYITGNVVRPSDTGDFYPSSNPSGFIDSSALSSYASQSYVNSISGAVRADIATLQGASGGYYPSSNPSGFVTGSVVRPSETGDFLKSSQTGLLTGSFYPRSANPNDYVTGSVVRPAETGAFASTGWIDQNYYPRANPSGYSSGGGGGGVSQARAMAISSLRI